ncbi:MAG: hypothetical protein ACREL5_08350 [Gemmatimonadales bacterium]
MRPVVWLLCAVVPLAASRQSMDVTGTWRVDPRTDTKNGPREVIIRPDSSASWGKETVRWRLTNNRMSIVLGGEWETYRVKVHAGELTLSGGDLKKAVTLKKVGPPTPRAPGVKIPDDPDR